MPIVHQNSLLKMSIKIQTLFLMQNTFQNIFLHNNVKDKIR